MVMYALAVLPLIHHLKNLSAPQVWYADDAAALGDPNQLRKWWDELLLRGPAFGYFVNPAKSWLIVKPHVMEDALSIFDDTNINITSDGHRYLGSPIGTDTFVSNFVREKIKDWVNELDNLVTISRTQPHAAYSCLIHGLFNKFVYLFRTTPNISDLVAPLEECIRVKLIPALIGQEGIRDEVRVILTLPCCLGGMGIIDLSGEAPKQHKDSVFILSPLIHLITQESDLSISSAYEDMLTRKSEVKKKHRSHLSAIVSALRDWRSLIHHSSVA